MKGNDKCSFRFSVLTKSYNMHTVQIQKVVERREAQAWKCLVSPSGTFFSQLFFNRWVKRCSVFAGEIFETGTRKIWWITFSFYRDRWSFQHRAQAAISSKASISSCAVCSDCAVFFGCSSPVHPRLHFTQMQHDYRDVGGLNAPAASSRLHRFHMSKGPIWHRGRIGPPWQRRWKQPRTPVGISAWKLNLKFAPALNLNFTQNL